MATSALVISTPTSGIPQPFILSPLVTANDLDVTQFGTIDGALTKTDVGTGATARVRLISTEDATDAGFARINMAAGEWTVGASLILQPKDDKGASPAEALNADTVIDYGALLIVVEENSPTAANNTRPWFGIGVNDSDQPDDLEVAGWSATQFGNWTVSAKQATYHSLQAPEIIHLLIRRWNNSGTWTLDCWYSLTGYAYRPLTRYTEGVTGQAAKVGIRLKANLSYVDLIRLGEITGLDETTAPWIRG